MITSLSYPLLEYLADMERGYDTSVFGGEELILIFGVIIAPLLIISHGFDRLRERGDVD